MVYNGHACSCPRKFNSEMFGDWPSAKIGLHENFPLYCNNIGTDSAMIYYNKLTCDYKNTFIVKH
jgi:hypothetical protein